MPEPTLTEVVPGWATSAAVAEYLKLSPQWVRKLRSEMRAVEVNPTTLLYPVRAVREFGTRPRPAPGWRKGKPRPEKTGVK